MSHIHHQLLIAAATSTVYDAITTQHGLSSWWTPGTNAKPEENTVARFPFGPNYYKEMLITRLKPLDVVEWSCIAGDEEWIGTSIRFQLESASKATLLKDHPELTDQLTQLQPLSEVTILKFQHNDWKNTTPMFAECNYTWGRFLWSLKLYCETGKGLPWPRQHSLRI